MVVGTCLKIKIESQEKSQEYFQEHFFRRNRAPVAVVSIMSAVFRESAFSHSVPKLPFESQLGKMWQRKGEREKLTRIACFPSLSPKSLTSSRKMMSDRRDLSSRLEYLHSLFQTSWIVSRLLNLSLS